MWALKNSWSSVCLCGAVQSKVSVVEWRRGGKEGRGGGEEKGKGEEKVYEQKEGKKQEERRGERKKIREDTHDLLEDTRTLL